MPRKQKRYHYIYKTTCDVTQRFYYGMHSTYKLNDGYIGSGTRLWHSINYYGRENHSIEILEYYDNREALKEREKILVNEDMLKDPNCMNLQPGGGGGFKNIKHQSKCTKAGNLAISKKFKEDPEYYKKMSDISKRTATRLTEEGRLNGDHNPGFKGKYHSSESRKKMSEADRTGSKNSQFGKCWITKDGSNKKIKKEYINIYIKLGWEKGRILSPRSVKL